MEKIQVQVMVDKTAALKPRKVAAGDAVRAAGGAGRWDLRPRKTGRSGPRMPKVKLLDAARAEKLAQITGDTFSEVV